MTEPQKTPFPPLPPDDPARHLTVVRREEDAHLTHLAVNGDTYTVVVSGNDTAGQYSLIEMVVPPSGGPPPHRHDYEEMFYLLEGELELTFRGQSIKVCAGDTVNIPANAPHCFRNISGVAARALCLTTASHLEGVFHALGTPVETRNTPPPPLSEAEQAAFLTRALAVLPEYRMELLPPG